MQRHFLILSSTDEAARDVLTMQSQKATGMSQAALGEGVVILTRSIEDVLPIPASKGYIVGTLFPKHGPARRLSRGEANGLDELVHADPIGCLRDRFWGGYVALLVDERGLILLRDPSGAMPCYLVPIPGGWAAASDVSLLAQAGLLKPQIVWRALPRYLAARDLPAETTAGRSLAAR